MDSGKVKISLEWLSDCGGCHVAVVDLHERILELLGSVEILHCPVLTDVKGYPPVDVGLVSGAIRNEHDRHMAEEMRRSSKLIVAFGTCAIYGGIPGAGGIYEREEILDRVYTSNRTTESAPAPMQGVAPLEKTVTPLDEVIDVDLYLPGCPPHPSFIFEALLALVSGREPRGSFESVCGLCRRAMVKTDVQAVKSCHEGIPEDEICLLSQGYVCMESVTLDRCLSPCPNNGMVCTGCAGPTLQVLTEPNRDIRTEIGERMSRLTNIDSETVVRNIERSSKSHYSYSMANRMIGEKPTFLIKQWIADVEAEA